MNDIKLSYDKTGYVLIKNYFPFDTLASLEKILLKHHDAWIADNQDFYQSEAVNSAYITGTKYLDNTERLMLFNFIASKEIQSVIDKLIAVPGFLNAQLFFDPVNPQQKNYWHRDMQYSNMNDDEIKRSMQNDMALHFRIPLRDEPGIELVPGTHYRWDDELEYKIRNQLDDHKHWEDLPNGKIIPLKRGDLLVFSANMIHRGLYSRPGEIPRFTLDLCLCDSDPQLLRYAQADAFPYPKDLEAMHNPAIFSNAIPHLIN